MYSTTHTTKYSCTISQKRVTHATIEEYDDIYGELSESGTMDISHKNFNILDDSLFDYKEKIRMLDFSYVVFKRESAGI